MDGGLLFATQFIRFRPMKKGKEMLKGNQDSSVCAIPMTPAKSTDESNAERCDSDVFTLVTTSLMVLLAFFACAVVASFCVGELMSQVGHFSSWDLLRCLCHSH